jgi:hypothetical protein
VTKEQSIFSQFIFEGNPSRAEREEKVLRYVIWVCPVSTDCLPLSHSTSSHSSFLVLSGAEMP